MKEEMLDAFMSNIGQALILVSEIEEELNNHFGVLPDDITFADINKAADVLRLLKTTYSNLEK